MTTVIIKHTIQTTHKAQNPLTVYGHQPTCIRNTFGPNPLGHYHDNGLNKTHITNIP